MSENIIEKEELRNKLLEIKNVYLKRNQPRLQKIKNDWNLLQKNIPKLDKLNPVIEFCDDSTSQNLWWYGRVTVSSAPLSGEVGRRIHYLIRDKDTGFIICIVGLSSDLTIPIRDNHIGWTKENKWTHKKINYLMNVQHCIATEPFNKYLTGKLAALSVISKEVLEHFENKYNHSLAAYTVTSLFGKSSIYNRLNGFIYLGETKGFSSVLIHPDIKAKMREDFKATKGKHSEIYYNEDGSIRYKYGVVKGYQKLSKYSDQVQRKENLRGVYLIPLAENYREFLKEEDENLKTLPRLDWEEIVLQWKERWFFPRIKRLNVEAI